MSSTLARQPCLDLGLLQNFLFLRISLQIILLVRIFNPMPIPSNPRGLMFSPLADRSLFQSFRNFLSAFASLSRTHVAQGPWRGHACIRLGRNEWHFLCFLTARASARWASEGPRTTARVFRRDSPPTWSRRNTGSGGERSSMLTRMERCLLALKAKEWLITTPLNFHEWTWPTTAQLLLGCHF
jgi:hypothetical protein